MNPPWLEEIIMGRIFFRKEAIILVRILYEEMNKEIGWNLENFVGFETLVIKARKEEFMFPPSFREWWAYCSILFRLDLMRYQKK